MGYFYPLNALLGIVRSVISLGIEPVTSGTGSHKTEHCTPEKPSFRLFY